MKKWVRLSTCLFLPAKTFHQTCAVLLSSAGDTTVNVQVEKGCKEGRGLAIVCLRLIAPGTEVKGGWSCG